jgi:CubicO group peptidase (beta-lactamase class C family)
VSAFDLVAEKLAAAVREERVLAGAVGLIAGGRVAGRAATGVTRPRGPEVGVDTLFGVGSITKLLTGLAAVRLAECGVLRLDVPVVELVPGLTFDDDAKGSRVTLRHVLTHSSGLPAAGRDWGPQAEGSLRRFAEEDLARHRFHATPGVVPCYSSTAFSLSGVVMEAATGRRFVDVLSDEVLDPSGMTRAGYPGRVADADMAWPHSRSDDGWTPEPRLADNPAGYPAGFLLGSVADLVNLANWILGEATLAEALTRVVVPRRVDHAPYPLARASAGFGIGCFTGEWNGRQVVRHGGMQQTFNCSLDVFPEIGGAVALITNGAGDDAFSELLLSCYEAIAGPGTANPGKTRSAMVANPTRHVGSYLDVNSGRIVDIRHERGGLFYCEDDLVVPLVPFGEGRHLAATADAYIPAWFPPGDEEVPFLVIWGTPFLRTELGAWKLSRDSERFDGLYRDSFWPDRSTDLDVRHHEGRWRVTAEGDASEGRAIGPHLVASDHGLLRFWPDAQTLQLGNATLYRRRHGPHTTQI